MNILRIILSSVRNSLLSQTAIRSFLCKDREKEKKKRLYNATSLKYVEKGKITNLKHLQVKAYHAIQIPLEFTKQKVVKCQSKFLLTFHVFHPHLQTSPKFPLHMAAGWGVPMSTVSMNPPPAEPAPSRSWPKGWITASDYSWAPST